MDPQTTVQTDAISNQGCKINFQDNMAYHLKGKGIQFLVAYLLYLLLGCWAICFEGKLVRMLTKLGQINGPYSQASFGSSAGR